MRKIRIQELRQEADQFQVMINIGEMEGIECSITNPFSQQEELDLEWYFEEYLRMPQMNNILFDKTRTSIAKKGEQLFETLFSERNLFRAYSRFFDQKDSSCRFEIIGSPAFHALHWEILKDPDQPDPFSLRYPIVRKTPGVKPQNVEFKESTELRILLVTSRPAGRNDVNYRTISRPLLEALRHAKLRVRINILRPGTFEALSRHLEAKDLGYYHILHFDGHGSLLSYDQLNQVAKQDSEASSLVFKQPFGRDEIQKYEGKRAFIFMEKQAESTPDPVEAKDFAKLLARHQVPMVILNACQSAKQQGQENTSLGSFLLEGGVQAVLAMSYSITVSAAILFITQFYQHLFEKGDFDDAVRRARWELAQDKERQAYFNEVIHLEDWMLPVVYQNQPLPWQLRDLNDQEYLEHYTQKATAYKQPPTTYGFHGRDLDLLEIEKLLLQHNLLLIQGMGGAGKSTLLRHMAYWWQSTGFVEQIFYFGFDEKSWNRQQILGSLAKDLFTESPTMLGRFLSAPEPIQQEMICEQLRSTRHLLILDNLESITGSHLAIGKTLSAEEQLDLKALLTHLVGGKTLVLLGSRGEESWLAAGTFATAVYQLSGLDQQASSSLARSILDQLGINIDLADQNFRKLLRGLQGFPLALEVILPNLKERQALHLGDTGLDELHSQDKTKSIQQCIDYSHSNLDPQAQKLLLCLALFNTAINPQYLPLFFEEIKKTSPDSDIPFDRWPEVQQQARDWGLINQHPKFGPLGYLYLQPTFPYFLKIRLRQPENKVFLESLERAFVLFYNDLGQALNKMMTDRKPEERQMGQFLAEAEWENINHAFRIALKHQIPFFDICRVIDKYCDFKLDHTQALELANAALVSLEKINSDLLADQFLDVHLLVLDNIGRCLLFLKKFSKSEEYYQKSLKIQIEFKDRYFQVSTYHQLGYVAREQHQWAKAEEYYQKSLEIMIEFKDRYSQAPTYHELGYVARGQRQWVQAEKYYQKALEIKIEFKDRYEQASTYHELGVVARGQCQWAQAEEYCKKSLEIKIEFKDRYSQAPTYHNLGVVAQEQRQWVQATEFYQKALEIKIEFKDRYSQASTYHNLGVVVQEQRQWVQAEAYYQKALEIKIEFKARYEQASTYHNLGIVAEEQAFWQQAKIYLFKAAKISNEFGDQHGLSITLRTLYQLFKETKDSTIIDELAEILAISTEEVTDLFNKIDQA